MRPARPTVQGEATVDAHCPTAFGFHGVYIYCKARSSPIVFARGTVYRLYPPTSQALRNLTHLDFPTILKLQPHSRDIPEVSTSLAKARVDAQSDSGNPK
eukprot:4510905-Amphidinium_carterae.2